MIIGNEVIREQLIWAIDTHLKPSLSGATISVARIAMDRPDEGN